MTKIGCLIRIGRPLHNRNTPRTLDEIEADISRLEAEIAELLKGLSLTASE